MTDRQLLSASRNYLFPSCGALVNFVFFQAEDTPDL